MTDIQEVIARAINRMPDESRIDAIRLALYEYYLDKPPTLDVLRECKMVTLSTKITEENLIRYFLESHEVKTLLETQDSFKSFFNNISLPNPVEGVISKVECVNSFGTCEPGKIYEGVWYTSPRPEQLILDLKESLPNIKVRPLITYDKNTKQITIPKQFKLL